MASSISTSLTSTMSSSASRAISSGSAPTNGGVSPSASVAGRATGTGLPAAIAGGMPGPAAHGLHLGARRVGRHDDGARHVDGARRPRHGLRVVAGRHGDEPAVATRGLEREHHVERAARLERTRLLKALALELERDAGALA